MKYINKIINIFKFGFRNFEFSLSNISDYGEKQKYVQEVLLGKTYKEAVLMFPSYDIQDVSNGIMTADIRIDRIRIKTVDNKIVTVSIS